MRSAGAVTTALALIAVPLAGCAAPGSVLGLLGGSSDVPEECAPGEGFDPYPADELFSNGSARLENGSLHIRACLVNGRDAPHLDECGAYPFATATVHNASSGEVVFADPPSGVGFPAVCVEIDIPADAEWPSGRYDVAWDLHKDVCSVDDRCRSEGEGERVPAGDYVVTVRHFRYVEPWNATVTLPGP